MVVIIRSSVVSHFTNKDGEAWRGEITGSGLVSIGAGLPASLLSLDPLLLNNSMLHSVPGATD